MSKGLLKARVYRYQVPMSHMGRQRRLGGRKCCFRVGNMLC